jgi:hypothetical protein
VKHDVDSSASYEGTATGMDNWTSPYLVSTEYLRYAYIRCMATSTGLICLISNLRHVVPMLQWWEVQARFVQDCVRVKLRTAATVGEDS